MYRLSQTAGKCCRALVATVLLGSTLAGCSEYFHNDLYVDRRENVSPTAGDALSANRVAQAVDPWSPASANRNIVYSGEKMQTASERYRTGRVIPPVNATTSSLAYQQAAQAAAGGAAATAPSSSPSVK